MTKPNKATKSQSPFESFKKITEALVAVPRKELQAKLQKYERQKTHKRRP